MKTYVFTRYNNIQYIVLVDILSGVLAYCIPILSHMIAYPLYLLDPMRLIVLLGFMWYKNKYNSAFLALTLPYCSFLLSGHPVMIKSALISFELLVNVLIVSRMIGRKINTFIVVVLSILISKIFYYLLKYAAIQEGLLKTELVDTNVFYQVITASFIAVIWWIYDNIIPQKS